MRILITAGPTREPIDSVRYLSNRSSGKMGLSIAQAGIEAGHDVTLLLGPIADVELDPKITVHRFESCANLEQLLGRYWPDHDLLIMAAAVADYRPAKIEQGKLPRGDAMTLALEPTPDLVQQAAANKQPHQHVVAFALEEPAVLIQRATAKMKRKGVDAMVANPLQTMDASDITATWMSASGDVIKLPEMGKMDFARRLIELSFCL